MLHRNPVFLYTYRRGNWKDLLREKQRENIYITSQIGSSEERNIHDTKESVSLALPFTPLGRKCNKLNNAQIAAEDKKNI